MMEINVINQVQTIEVVFGIYRNYITYNRKCKIFIIIRIIFQLLIYLSAFTHNIFWLLNSDVNVAMFFLSTFNLICIVTFLVCSVQNSAHYKILTTNLIAVHYAYNDNCSYNRRLQQLKSIFLVGFTIYVFMGSCCTLFKMVYEAVFISHGFYTSETPLVYVWRFTYRLHYNLEFFALYVILKVLCNLIKCLNDSLAEIQLEMKTEEYSLQSNRHGHFCNESNVIFKISQWTDLYECIVNCRQELSKCFEYQVNIEMMLLQLFSLSSLVNF